MRSPREDGRRLERQPDFALPPDHLIPTGNRPIAQTRFCPSCGNETGPGDRFCRRCGHPL